MKKHNERGAGRKPKYNCATKLKRIPIIAEKKIDELLIPYLSNIPKNNKTLNYR